MLKLRITCQGKKPILFCPKSAKLRDTLKTGVKQEEFPKDMPYEEIANRRLHRENGDPDGAIGLPRDMLMACLVAAGSLVKFDAKNNITNAKKSKLPGLIDIEENFFRFPIPDGAKETRHHGLAAAGRAVLTRAQRLGMIVDLSHLSEEAFWAALAATRGPVIASHSNAAALAPDPRNLTDRQLRAIAARGGVVGVTFYPGVLGAATLERVLDHVDHVARVAGVQTVALGSDFDGIKTVPAGLEDPSRLPNLTMGLLRRGRTPEQILAILGGNAMRVFEQVLK